MQNLLPEKTSTQTILQLSREELVGRVISQQQVTQFWILDFGFWILDFGFWIVKRYEENQPSMPTSSSTIQNPKSKIGTVGYFDGGTTN